MCGRFTLEYQLSMLYEHFDMQDGNLEVTPRYNIAPTQQIPVVRNDGERNTLAMMRWGLVPFWSKAINSRYTMINARDDKILETRSYSGPFKTKRCLIPATGFYEWKKGPDKTKQPMLIRLKTGGLHLVACGLRESEAGFPRPGNGSKGLVNQGHRSTPIQGFKIPRIPFNKVGWE